MPIIMTIKDLRNATEISDLAHKEQIDQAIFESEQEIANGADAACAEKVFEELERKHFG